MKENMCAIVIEPDSSLRQSYCLLLASAGYRVTSTPDRLQAADLLSAAPFDLILLDIEVTREGAGECLTALRQAQPAARLVLLCPDSFQSLHFDPFSLGADACVEIPCPPQAILQAARRFQSRLAARAARTASQPHPYQFAAAR